jgi:hypothetical protein
MAKYTYIKLDIRGYYIEFDEKFNPSLYNNLGETYEDFLDNKWVLLSDEQVQFHIDNPNASVKEVWDMELTPIPERTLEQAKDEMKRKINEYDISENVNGFIIHDTINHVSFNGWFTAEERSNYKSSIDAAKLLGLETLSFFVGNVLLNVTPAQAEFMLAQIQLYADQCYIVTKQNKIAVDALDTIEEVDAFKYDSGYPEKITFDYPFQGI